MSDSNALFSLLGPSRIVNPCVDLLHTPKCTDAMKALPHYLLYCMGRRKGSSACAVEIYRVLAVHHTLLGIRYLIEWFYAPKRYTIFWVGSSSVLIQKIFCFVGSTPLKRRSFLVHPLVGLVRWSALPTYVLPHLDAYPKVPVVLPPYAAIAHTRKREEADEKWRGVERAVREVRYQLALCKDYAPAVEEALRLLLSDCPVAALSSSPREHTFKEDRESYGTITENE